MAYKNPDYDPRKAHEYYMRTRKLKGRRRSTAGLNEQGKAAALAVKTALTERRNAEIERHKEALNKKIISVRSDVKNKVSKLNDQYKEQSKAITANKKLTTAQKQAQRKKLQEKFKAAKQKIRDAAKENDSKMREANRATRERIKEKYNKQYETELSKMKGDAALQTGGTSIAILNDAGKEAARQLKEQLTAQKKAEIERLKENVKTRIEALRQELKYLTPVQRKGRKEQYAQMIASIRENNKAAVTRVKEKYNQDYKNRLALIRGKAKYR